MAIGPNRKYMTRSQVESAQIDVGLRDYMLRVYNYMSLGVAFTGAIAMVIAMNPALVQGVMSMFWIFFIGILGLGFFAPRIMMSKSIGAAQICFWVYAAMWGALIGPMLYAYAQIDPMIIAQAFFITAGTFAGVSLYGYVTKRDLSPFATFFMMASIGLVIAIVVNAFFLQSAGFSLLTSVLVVLLFFYMESDGHDVATRKAIFGAFMLYGSFVTLFVHILNILGLMRN